MLNTAYYLPPSLHPFPRSFSHSFGWSFFCGASSRLAPFPLRACIIYCVPQPHNQAPSPFHYNPLATPPSPPCPSTLLAHYRPSLTTFLPLCFELAFTFTIVIIIAVVVLIVVAVAGAGVVAVAVTGVVVAAAIRQGKDLGRFLNILFVSKISAPDISFI